ncbi:cytochrome b/b6 domain-containing protein [Sphingosinicella terrae]|uniref:cytochrome b/b6 domain-containing protein n=1 Tax=Sphingosinicella terrae TaxID=2172047 RepID=UPI000E0D3B11|nr:cytochrome b/b6 domain-containing protein [Sphingosinicella terrae]
MRAKIWDLPTRLFHWLLVLLIAGAWWTAENDALAWHYRAGFAIVALLVFRLVWGLIGSSTARFSSFVKGPGAIRAYLGGRAPASVGHNPLGALSVLALLGLLVVHVVLGLISSDEDGLDPAPLAHLVSYDLSEAAHELHEDGFNLLLVLIGIHVAAILYHGLVKRRNLLRPMVTGRGDVPAGAEPMRAVPAWRLLPAAAFALLFAWWIWSGAPPF